MVTLPRGRGSLPPQASAFLQRARILDATVRVVAQDGYAAATVSAIQVRAGVSRRTFYDVVPNKEGAVAAAFDSAARYATPQILASFAAQRGWVAGVDAALTTYLALLDADRDWAALALVGLPSSGEQAMADHDRILGPLVEELAGEPSARPVAVGAVAALNNALRGRLADRATPLSAARAEGLALLIAPFRGAAMARRQAARPAVDVVLRDTDAERVRRLLAAAEPATRETLRDLVERAARDGDGPALLQAALGWQEGLVAGRAVDEPLLRRVLQELETAWFCGLPLDELATGKAGAWLPRSARDRCLAWLAAHPDSTARQIGTGAGIAHHSTAHRLLAQLEQAGTVSRRPGPGRAALWRLRSPAKKS